MLITFKSEADGDVIMFGRVGQQMLAIFGKDPNDTQGIITVAQLPAAIAALSAAIEQDKAEQAQKKPDDDFFSARDPSQAPPDPVISFTQRAVPLLEMLRHAARAEVVVTWAA